MKSRFVVEIETPDFPTKGWTKHDEEEGHVTTGEEVDKRVIQDLHRGVLRFFENVVNDFNDKSMDDHTDEEFMEILDESVGLEDSDAYDFREMIGKIHINITPEVPVKA